MKNTLLLLLTCFVMTASAQRYLEPQFQVEKVDSLTPYGTNISVLAVVLGQSTTPQPQTLRFDVYRPAGDTETNRPAVIVHHTGSYMPIALNGGLTGTINDAAVVEMASRFASLGYVAFVPEYRQGWNTIAPDVDEQTSTLLIASLRGAQDMQMMTRYLRMTVAEQGNVWGIDAERVLAIGLGTGGYNVSNSNFLDDPAEVNDLDKFIDSRNNLPYYDPSVFGNVYGTDQTALNLPNWASYDNGFAMGVNLGGAMGDASWIEGEDSEAPMLGMHSTTDANAPFGIGNILVPTTGNTVLQDAPGSRIIVELCNDNGNNDALANINAQLLAAGDDLTTRVDALKGVDFTTRSGYETTLSTENMYPFVNDPTMAFANEYNYVPDTAALGAAIRPVITAANLPFTFAQLVQQEQASNRNFLNPAGAQMVLDTITRFIAPRAYAALDLAGLINVEDISAESVGLSIAPNPAAESTVLTVDNNALIEEVTIVASVGNVVSTTRFDASRAVLDLTKLAPGIHYLLIRTNEGVVVERLLKQ